VPSGVECRAAALIVAAMLFAAPPAKAAAQRAEVVSASRTDPVEIARALDAVKRDPNLAAERTIRVLRWKSGPPKSTRQPGWVSWIAGFFIWVAESLRLLIWGGALLLAGLVAVYLWRAARARLTAASGATFVAPTHVRDLDIRPETLPADIGRAARQLWERGEQRAALALLYRGMLSRLVHVHHVALRDSSTEGDCLALATARLPLERSAFLARLVRAWQRLGYGHEAIETAAVHELCDEFASALRPLPETDGIVERATA
jgi:hypothetical protein